MASAIAVDSLFAHAVRLLINRPYGSQELETRLAQLCRRRQLAKRAATRAVYASVEPAAIAKSVIQRLTATGALDDAYAAEWHVQQRVRFRQRSRAQLSGELAQKRLRGGVATRALQQHDELAAAAALAAKKARVSDAALVQHLTLKGFPWPIVSRVMEARRTGADLRELAARRAAAAQARFEGAADAAEQLEDGEQQITRVGGYTPAGGKPADRMR